MAITFPCGSVEEFVLSSNRRKQLQIDSDTKDNDDSTNIHLQSGIIYGSDKHLHFHFLEIENEITSILVNIDNLDNLSESDSNKKKLLLNESNKIMSKYQKKRTKNNMTPQLIREVENYYSS